MFPTLAIDDIGFQNAPWGSRPQMATAIHLEVKVALLPLLRRTVRIDRLLLEELELFIEIDSKGRSNLAFKPAEPEPADSRVSQAAGGYRLGAVREVAVENGKLTIYDRRNGKTDRLILPRLEIRGWDLGLGGDVELEAVWNEIPFAVNGRIGTLKSVLDPREPWSLDLSLNALQGNAVIKGGIGDPLGLSGIELMLSAEGKHRRRDDRGLRGFRNAAPDHSSIC